MNIVIKSQMKYIKIKHNKEFKYLVIEWFIITIVMLTALIILFIILF